MPLPRKIEEIIKKGVRITDPFSIEIGDEVNPDRISGQGVVIYNGTRIYGANTLISAGAKIGFEGPATIVDCQLGPLVELKGGFFQSSVFLQRASIASGAQVREGSLLEEETKAGHTVGLKQTILFPFVTLGSLINFCDCLMAGGTGRDNHSEVGSSYVHFNYTPQQDKATASLIGDVPRGVMLDQPPVFLGGQGGLVGPLRIDFGTVITAGTVWRHDSSGTKVLHGSDGRPRSQEYNAGAYGDIRRKVTNNVMYIANLRALEQWYGQVRRPFFQKREFGEELLAASLQLLAAALQERLKQFRSCAGKMYKSAAIDRKRVGEETDLSYRQRELADKWTEIEDCLLAPLDEEVILRCRDSFLEIFFKQGSRGDDYLEAIRGLEGETKLAGTCWLQGIVDCLDERVKRVLPSFSSYLT